MPTLYSLTQKVNLIQQLINYLSGKLSSLEGSTVAINPPPDNYTLAVNSRIYLENANPPNVPTKTITIDASNTQLEITNEETNENVILTPTELTFLNGNITCNQLKYTSLNPPIPDMTRYATLSGNETFTGNVVFSNPITGIISGTATNATNVNITSKTNDENYSVLFSTDSSGNLGVDNASKGLTFNPYNRQLGFNYYNSTALERSFLSSQSLRMCSAPATQNVNESFTLVSSGGVSINNYKNYDSPDISITNLYPTLPSNLSPRMDFRRYGRNAQVGDVNGTISFSNSQNAGGYYSYCDIQGVVSNATAGASLAGRLDFNVLKNNYFNRLFTIDGNNQTNTMYAPLNMSSNNITNVGTITATSFSGTATNATNVIITDQPSTASNYYLTFVTNTSGNNALYVDSALLTYNSSTNLLLVNGLQLGTATNVIFSFTANVLTIECNSASNREFSFPITADMNGLNLSNRRLNSVYKINITNSSGVNRTINTTLSSTTSQPNKTSYNTSAIITVGDTWVMTIKVLNFAGTTYNCVSLEKFV
jgi:hypothetical protein